MTLAPGSKLGPYEILAPIGAGGMGEVYRARDPRLTREVAIKVLPATFSQDPDRLKRFEVEARAAGVLNHPNITAVYDFGTHDGAPYIVTELLEGETLRSRLGPGAISPRKSIDYAVQIAKGLAAAHEKGIVHRDLKPENVFLTKDGRVKILDFGLAKLKLDGGESGQTDVGTVSGGTQPGVVLGTMGYMSPEQVRGKPADKRSDLFSFGTILYEMLAGQRAFRGDTAADTITAILTKEPPDLSQTNKDVPPGLDRIVRHCLEKNPEERFESARDVAFDLEALSGLSGTSTATGVHALPAERSRKPWLLLALAAVLGGGHRGAVRLLRRQEGRLRRAARPSARSPSRAAKSATRSSRRMDRRSSTPQPGTGRPFEVFINRPESPESRPFGLPLGQVARHLDVRRDGGPLEPSPRRGFRAHGPTRADLDRGRRSRETSLMTSQCADWSPDGKDLAIVRQVGAKNRLEYPIGKLLFETAGWISHPRVSPYGDARRLPRPSRPQRRRWPSSRRGPRREEGNDHAPLCDDAGPRLGAGRQRDLVHGGGRRLQPRRARRDAGGQEPPRRTRAGHQHDPRHLEERPRPDDQRERPPRHPGRAGPARDEEQELSWLDYSLVTDITSGRAHASSSRSRARAAVRRTRRTCGASTARPPCGSARGRPRRSRRTERGRSRITHTATPQIVPSADERGRAAGPVARRTRRLQRRLSARREVPSSSPRPSQDTERGSTA